MKDEKEVKERYELKDVATQTTPMIYDNTTKESIPLEIGIVKILNILEKLQGLL